MKNVLKFFLLLILSLCFTNSSESNLQIKIYGKHASKNKTAKLIISIRNFRETTIIETNKVFKKKYTEQEANRIISSIDKRNMLPLAIKSKILTALQE